MTGPVFISFDHGAALAYTDALARYLSGTGVPVWYDREVGGEQRWAQTLAQLQNCAAVVVVMTPEAEQSSWVAGEIGYAQQLGKPIVPVLLAGPGFPGLSHLPAEPVQQGAMPGPAFVAHLKALAGPLAYPVPAAPARRTNVVIGVVAGALALLLVGVVAVGFVVWKLAQTPTGPQTWQAQAADIDGIQNYLVSHPDWYQFDPTVGNHHNGRLTYPVDPPAGGVHNPRWQNCMGDVYPDQVPKEHVMHSLEHGAVWITYRPGLPADQVEQLARRVRNIPYTLMSPYPGLDRPISLQAWGYQLKLDSAGDARIDQFLSALRKNASQEPQASCSGGVSDTGTEPTTFG